MRRGGLRGKQIVDDGKMNAFFLPQDRFYLRWSIVRMHGVMNAIFQKRSRDAGGVGYPLKERKDTAAMRSHQCFRANVCENILFSYQLAL